jgi:uncharacterized protein YqeY
MENTTGNVVTTMVDLTLKQRIDADIKSSMLAKDTVTRDALRVIKAEISREEAGLKDYKDEDVIRVIKKAIKNLETINTMESRREITILEKYIPSQLSESEIQSFLQILIQETGALSVKDMGKTIAAFNAKFPGQADGKIVSEIVKRMLSNAANS